MIREFESCFTTKEKRKTNPFGVSLNKQFKYMYKTLSRAIEKNNNKKIKIITTLNKKINELEEYELKTTNNKEKTFTDKIMKLTKLSPKSKAFLLLLVEFFNDYNIAVDFLLPDQFLFMVKVFLKKFGNGNKLTKLQQQKFNHFLEVSKLYNNKEVI